MLSNRIKIYVQKNVNKFINFGKTDENVKYARAPAGEKKTHLHLFTKRASILFFFRIPTNKKTTHRGRKQQKLTTRY